MKSKTKYKHSEAFCTMRYECETCGFSEVLWNSRDGVTPFVMECPICGGTMIHVDGDLDQCLPDYLPKPNQRVFVDSTPQIYEVLVRARIQRQWNDESYPMKDRFETPMDAVMSLSNFTEGMPYIIRISKRRKKTMWTLTVELEFPDEPEDTIERHVGDKEIDFSNRALKRVRKDLETLLTNSQFEHYHVLRFPVRKG